MTNETVFNTVPNTKQNRFMFFGEKPNLARYDELVHPIFDKLTAKQKSFFWQPEEIDLNKDIKDFKILSDAQKSIFINTISYQIVLDTIQARSPALALLPFCTLPELEACIEWWCAMEQMHNHAYSYTLRNLFPTPAVIFDGVVVNDKIKERAERTVKYYDEFINLGNRYRVDEKSVDMTELKRALIMCVASINALEGLSFYASFACTFAFAEQGLMEGNAKEISLIARDEALHLAITQNILKKWSSGSDDPEMAKLYVECLPEIEQLYLNIVKQEKEWCEYLFKDGSMIGLNTKILSEYVEYTAGKRMKNLGIKTSFTTKNPIPWVDKYLNSSDVQDAPQEVDLSSYIIGGVKNDLNDTDFSNFL